MGLLRILLALAVVITHSGSSLNGLALPGAVAVQAFFMISGFYIALILNRKYCFRGATKLFYQQRYLRLAPMYWLAILTTYAASALYSAASRHPAGKLQIWAAYGHDMSLAGVALLAVTHASMLGLDGLMFCEFSGHPLAPHFTMDWTTAALPAVRFMPLPPAWSLSVELLFYMVAPLLVRRSVRLQLAVAAAAFLARVAAMRLLHLPPDPWNSRFFPFEAGLFILGSVAFRALPAATWLIDRAPALRWALLGVILPAMAFYGRIPLAEDVRHWAFLAGTLVAIPLLFAASRRSAADRWIGEMSYPLYLIHQVVLFMAEPLTRRLGGAALDAEILLLPLGAAALLYAVVERPIEAWRARRFDRLLDKNQIKNPMAPSPPGR